MAHGTVRVEIGADAKLHRRGGVGEADEPGEERDFKLVEFPVEKTETAPLAKLVVGHTVGIFEIAVDLARLHAQHAARLRCVAGEAVLPTGIKPALRARAVGGGNRNVLIRAGGHDVGVGIVRAPFVARAINIAAGVADEQARFEAVEDVWIRVVNGKRKVLNEHGSGGKCPFALCGKMNLGIRRQRHPAKFHRSIRPERRIDGVRNQAVGGLQFFKVGERARLREQLRHRMRGRWRTAALQFENNPADAAHLAEVNLAVGVNAEGRQAGVIRAGVRAGALGHDAEDGFGDGRGRLVHRPDCAIDVVAENVFAAEVAREFLATINIAADDGASVTVRIIEDRLLVDADVGRRQVALPALDAVPLKIQAGLARLDDLHRFARAFANIADENPVRHRINRHPMRAAQAEAEEFLQHIGLADKRIVVRDEIIRREPVRRLARRRVADISAQTIHVNAEHAGI